MVGAVNMFSSFIGIYTLQTFGRRTLLLAGQSIITILLFSLACVSVFRLDSAEVGLICLFIFVFQTTTNVACFAYAVETITDSSLSLVIFIDSLWGIFNTLTFSPLMAWSEPATFSLFAIITGISVVFVYFFVGETKGLSDREKKEIFMPGANWGRPLKEGEQVVPELGREHMTRKTLKSMALSKRLIETAE